MNNKSFFASAILCMAVFTAVLSAHAQQSSGASATIEIVGALDYSCFISGNKGSLIGTASSNLGKTLDPNLETQKLKKANTSFKRKIKKLKKSIRTLKANPTTPHLLKKISAAQKQIKKLLNSKAANLILINGINNCVNGALTIVICGNGSVENGEECDDGNNFNGDCCTKNCKREPAGSTCTATNAVNCGQCDSSGQCVASASGSACNDRDACTSGDTCQLGICSGSSVVCPTRAHAASSCNLGLCSLTCDSGFVDANSDSSDGCESAICASGLTSCSGVCKDTSRDRDHCGTCTTVCAGNQLCQSGSCVNCAVGSTVCSGQCTNIASDSKNCGACGLACSAGASCVAGVCKSCPPGQNLCGDSCVDLSSNNSNCGSCGTTCASGSSCVAGVCKSCPLGQVLCAGNCVEISKDSDNCGGCGLACAGNAICSAGLCAACPANQTRCLGACVDTKNDTKNCGACGTTCPANLNCLEGKCVSCPIGQILCAGQCTSTQTDVNNCGICGNTCAGGNNSTPTCNFGICDMNCSAGFANCDGSAANGCEAQLKTDVKNCGGCGLVCPSGNALNSSCDSGICSATCSGEHFDVDADLSNGCEVLDTFIGNHSEATAAFLGTRSCSDGESATTISGQILSDSRVHSNPVVNGFSLTTGSTPDWFVVQAAGGICTNDLLINFFTKGGGTTPCYRLSVITNKGTLSKTVTGNDIGVISSGAGAYSNNSSIFFVVEKICKLPTQENVSYTINFHL